MNGQGKFQPIDMADSFLQIKTVNPFDSSNILSVKFWSWDKLERKQQPSGGITLKFNHTEVPKFQVLVCNKEEPMEMFPTEPFSDEITTPPFVWTIQYRKQSRQIQIDLNGVTVLNFTRSEDSCTMSSFVNSNGAWDRDKEDVQFLKPDTASLAFRILPITRFSNECKFSWLERSDINIVKWPLHSRCDC